MTINDGTWALPWTKAKVEELKKILNTKYGTLNDLTNDIYSVVGDDELFDWLYDTEDRNGNFNNESAKNYIKRRVYQFINQYEENPNDFVDEPEEGVIEELKKIVFNDSVISKEMQEEYLKPFKNKMKDSFGVEFYVEGNLLEGHTETGFETYAEAKEYAEDQLAIISQNGMEEEIPLENIAYNIFDEDDEEIDLSELEAKENTDVEDSKPKKDSLAGIFIGIYLQKASEAITEGKSKEEFVDNCLKENEQLDKEFLEKCYESAKSTMEKDAEAENADVEDSKVDLNKEDYSEEDFVDITEEELNNLEKEDEFSKYIYGGIMINLMPKDLFIEYCNTNKTLSFKYKDYDIKIEMPYSIEDGWAIYINDKSFINLTLDEVYEKLEKIDEVYEAQLSEDEKFEREVSKTENQLNALVEEVNTNPTMENVGKFEAMLEFYSDIFKDTYGFRPRTQINGFKKALNQKASELDHAFFDLDYSEQLKLMGYAN